MNRLIGLETEYGIAALGKDAGDLVEQTVALLETLPAPFVDTWDYSGEQPTADLRGFRAPRLARDAEDEKLEKKSATPAATVLDRCLPNGARLYNDHGHPEYSTPECRLLFDLVAHDAAGQRILLECAERRAAAGQPVALYKNNTDYHGFSYGCHENYLVARDLPADDLIAGLVPFLVTRQIFAGAGKVGIDGDKDKGPVLQLSQRADFVTTIASVDTLAQRPIVNTRDEPHADATRYRRLHNIIGDANMSRYATALKVGTTCLVLSCLEAGWRPSVALKEPVAAIKEISRDQNLEWRLTLDDGSAATALDVQRHYLQAAKAVPLTLDADAQWALEQWEQVLDALAGDPLSLSDRLDWVVKRRLFSELGDAAEQAHSLQLLQSLDLEYHNIDPAKGLFYAAVGEGDLALDLIPERSIARATSRAPQDTRARLRGLLVEKYAAAIREMSWGRLRVSVSGSDRMADLRPLVDGSVSDFNRQAEAAADLAAVLALIGGGEDGSS